MSLPQHHEHFTALCLGSYAAAARKKRVLLQPKPWQARDLSCVAQQRDDMCVCARAQYHMFSEGVKQVCARSEAQGACMSRPWVLKEDNVQQTGFLCGAASQPHRRLGASPLGCMLSCNGSGECVCAALLQRSKMTFMCDAFFTHLGKGQLADSRSSCSVPWREGGGPMPQEAALQTL